MNTTVGELIRRLGAYSVDDEVIVMGDYNGNGHIHIGDSMIALFPEWDDPKAR